MVECLLHICRACLTEKGEFQSVFVSDESSGLNIHLAEMLMACASIQVTFGDGLPEQICKACAEKIVSLFLFKIKCEESDSRLRNQLGKSPLKEEYISLPFNDDVDVTDLNVISACPTPDIDVVIDSQISHDENEARFDSYNTDNSESETQDKDENNDKINFYKCKLCPKVYNRSSNLVRHEKFHLHDQLFWCEVCEKKFTRKDLLERHKLAHAKKNNQKLDEEKSDILDCTSITDILESKDKSEQHSMDNISEEKQGHENEDKESKLVCKICKKSLLKHLD